MTQPRNYTCIFFFIFSLGVTFYTIDQAFGQSAASIKPLREYRSQPEKRLQSRSADIKVDVPLVLLNVTVTDQWNRVVTGLRKTHFTVKEDKVPQNITQFGAHYTPLSVGLVFDASESMGYKLVKAREAVSHFIKESHPADEFFVVRVGRTPELAADFTREGAEIQTKLLHIESKGRTALLDAVYFAVNKMRQASNTRKAILIVSDGGDNNSRYTERELSRLVKEADVQIYSLGIFEPGGMMRTPEELEGPRLLTRLAKLTGGAQFPIKKVGDLPAIIKALELRLRNQYVLGYIPSNREKDGKWRRLRIEVKDIEGLPYIQAYTRLGYYAPAY